MYSVKSNMPGAFFETVPGKLNAFSAEMVKEHFFRYEISKPMLQEDEMNRLMQQGKLIHQEKLGFHPMSVCRLPDGSVLWIQKSKNSAVMLAYRIDRDWKKWTLLYDATHTAGRFSFEYLGRIFSYSVLPYQGLVLHGVLMEYKGRGIILCGASGVGKTPQARLWRNTERALILNGDRALCKREGGVWCGYGMPWCGSSGEYINRSVPICAIVVLAQRSYNRAEILKKVQSFQYLYPHLLFPEWEKNMAEQAIDTFCQMTEQIPVIRLECRPEPEAVNVLKEKIEQALTRDR